MDLKEAITKPEVNFFLSILIPLVALGVAYGAVTARLDYMENKVSAMEVELNEQTSVNEEIKVRLAEIQKDIVYIRSGLDKHLAQ